LWLGPSPPPRPLGRPGTLLGALESVEVSEVTATLGPGEAVVFFTDGVTEARSEQGFFGEERLASLLGTMRGKDAGEIARGLVDAMVDFQHGDPRDDIAVVVVRMPPQGAGP
jgi:sigma-B regulation protein RsbU (phosphoserine phosphatase)